MWSTARLQVTALVNFFQVATRSNFLITALNTIAILTIRSDPGDFYPYIRVTEYSGNVSTELDEYHFPNCGIVDSIAPAGFYPISYEQSAEEHNFWPFDPVAPELKPNALAMLDGFFSGCTPLHAILASTLDCLYRQGCLEQFGYYFPALKRVCMSLAFVSDKNLSHLDQLELEKSPSQCNTKIWLCGRSFKRVVD